MRKLKFTDVGKASKIIRKLNLRADSIDTENVEAMGASIFLKIIENYSNVENEVAEFMADIVEVTPEKFKELELDQVMNYIVDLKEDSGFSNFLNTVKKLTTPKN